MTESEKEEDILTEVMALINCYFFDFPQATECYRAHHHYLIKMPLLLKTLSINNASSERLIDSILRLIRNSLVKEIVRPVDLEGQNIV